MTLLLLIFVATLLIIALSEYLGERIGVVTPVILLAIGIGVGLLPQVPDIEISPVILIEVILPPLLFSAAVQMPTQDFRRNLGAISSLAIALVILSSLAVGTFLHFILKVDYATAIALGAIMSPTDAVATTIVKRQGVSRRVITILEGEGLMNDAAALVVLRAAIVAMAGSVSLWQITAQFFWSILGAMLVGFVVGHASLWLRAHVHQEHASTIIAFSVPFLASIPAEHIGASGLVAAVIAGLVTSRHMALALSPATRNVGAQTWGTLGLILESVVFLSMGVQLANFSGDFAYEEESWLLVIGISIACITILLISRALIVLLTSGLMNLSLKHRERVAPRARSFSKRVDRALSSGEPVIVRGRSLSSRWGQRLSLRLSRAVADIGYYTNAPMGPREDGVIIWSGMRGAVTVAAAQTLPLALPDRGLYLILAFVVATMSLIVQGLSLDLVIRLLKPAPATPVTTADIRSIRAHLHEAVTDVEVPEELDRLLGTVHPETLWTQLVQWQHSHTPLGEGVDDPREIAELQRVKVMTIRYAIDLVKAQRAALVDERDSGRIDADVYAHSLKILDSDQLRLEIHLDAALAGVEDTVEDELTVN